MSCHSRKKRSAADQLAERQQAFKKSASQSHIINSFSRENGKRIFEDHLNMDFEGNSVHVAFKCQYFQDVLRSLESEFVLLNLGRGENDACIVRVPERDDCEFVIMPMKIN